MSYQGEYFTVVISLGPTSYVLQMIASQDHKIDQRRVDVLC